MILDICLEFKWFGIEWYQTSNFSVWQARLVDYCLRQAPTILVYPLNCNVMKYSHYSRTATITGPVFNQVITTIASLH